MTTKSEALHGNVSTTPTGEDKILPAGRDFIALKLLAAKRGVLIILCVCFLLSSLPIFLAWLEGNLTNSSLKIDALSDIGYHNQFFLLLPFMVIFIPYYLNSLAPTIERLRESRMLGLTEEEYNVAIKYSNALFERGIITFLPYIVGMGITVFGMLIYMFPENNNWNSSTSNSLPISAIPSFIPVFLLYYLIAVLLVRVVAIHFVVKKFLAGDVMINPLHPDKCGGLSPLGDFSLRITKAGIAIGAVVVIGVLANYYQHKMAMLSLPNVVVTVGYILGLSIVFFLPLLAARKSMRSAKAKELKTISDHFQQARQQCIAELGLDGFSGGVSFSKVEGLTKLHSIAKSMPVFPFNAENVVRFLTSVLWPSIVYLVKHYYEAHPELWTGLKIALGF